MFNFKLNSTEAQWTHDAGAHYFFMTSCIVLCLYGATGIFMKHFHFSCNCCDLSSLRL